jgi:excisionase family DNA binding protein
MAVTEAQLKTRGLSRSFREIVEEAQAMTAWAISTLPAGRGPANAASEFNAAELAALRRGGLEPEASHAGAADPLASTISKYAAMLATGLTTEEAAHLLSVSTGRIRQRLAARTLYGIKSGHGYRLPLFQFERAGAVPRIGEVLQALGPDLHPVAVQNWFTHSCPDLSFNHDERPVSPRDWLLGGGPPSALIALAKDV